MAKLIEIHPKDPQARRVAEVVQIIRNGGLIAYPTDSSYAFGCHIGDARAINRIHRIRRTDKKHNFTLVCKDLKLNSILKISQILSKSNFITNLKIKV